MSITFTTTTATQLLLLLLPPPLLLAITAAIDCSTHLPSQYLPLAAAAMQVCSFLAYYHCCCYYSCWSVHLY